MPWDLTARRAGASPACPPASAHAIRGTRSRAAPAAELDATRSPPRRLDRGDVDLLHPHHRIERALGGRPVLTGRGVHERPRRDLPGQTPSVLAPPALALGSPVIDYRVPVAIGLGLILCEDLKRERFAVLERRAAIEAEARYAQHRKLDRQHLALLAVRVIPRGTVDRGDGAIWKRLGVEPGGCFCRAVVPKANDVLGHLVSPLCVGRGSPSF